MAALRREIFEPFGGLKPAMHAARDDRDGEALLEMNSWEGDVMTSDPDYKTPQVKELEIVLIVWDVLYMRGQVCLLPDDTCPTFLSAVVFVQRSRARHTAKLPCCEQQLPACEGAGQVQSSERLNDVRSMPGPHQHHLICAAVACAGAERDQPHAAGPAGAAEGPGAARACRGLPHILRHDGARGRPAARSVASARMHLHYASRRLPC